MTCLNDEQIQAAADGEADGAIASHLSGCARCRARVDERRADVDVVARALEATAMPADAEARIRTAIGDAAGAGRLSAGGATALRARSNPFRAGDPQGWHRAAFALAAAAGILLSV